MEVIRTAEGMQELRRKWNNSVGFVPTMGALHEGHAELLKKSVKENEKTVLSIFVNPTQFNNQNDFEKYPKTFAKDLEMAQDLGVDIVFMPVYDSIYPDQYRYKISENELSLDLCGKDRPGHFDGVLTIVMKLFNIVAPRRAYFGEKDFQQLSLVKGLVQSFFLPIEVVGVPTVRERDGLAMSSRNLRLKPEERQRASLILKSMKTRETPQEVEAELSQNGFGVDYVKDMNGRRFVAAKIGEVRLIDNIGLK